MLQRIILSISILFLVQTASASPWINSDDKYLHSSLQILQKSEKLDLALLSYPLSWVNVLEQLSQLDFNQLNEAEKLAFLRLMTASDFSKQENINTLILSGSSDPISSGLQGARFDESAMFSLMTENKGSNWAIGLRSNYRVDARDDKEHHFDGSYAAVALGNWVVSLSQQPLWLGNMHSQGEQLGWQGRSPKTIQLSRLNPSKSLISNDDVTIPIATRLIIGEMPGSVSLRHAKFGMASITSTFLSNVELGITVAQLQDLPDTLFSDRLPLNDKLKEIQVDFRFNANSFGFYTQLVRQDGLNTFSSQFGSGVDYHTLLKDWQTTVFVEYRHFDTDFFSWRRAESFANSLLIDPFKISNDYNLGAHFYRSNGLGVSIKLTQYNFKNSELSNALSLYGSVQMPLWQGLISVDLHHTTKKLTDKDTNTQLAARFEYRW